VGKELDLHLPSQKVTVLPMLQCSQWFACYLVLSWDLTQPRLISQLEALGLTY
jgi:hypothetical protein